MRVFIPLDVYALAIKVTKVSDDTYSVDQIRKVAGQPFGAQMDAVPKEYTGLRTMMPDGITSLSEGVPEKLKNVNFRLIRKAGGFVATPSAVSLLKDL
jgi:hypothetical protein